MRFDIPAAYPYPGYPEIAPEPIVNAVSPGKPFGPGLSQFFDPPEEKYPVAMYD